MTKTRDEHHKDYNDLEWAMQQGQGPPQYVLGDVVEFHAGGVAVIVEVSPPQSGWPSSYSVAPLEGYPCPNKQAWYYEGDFEHATIEGLMCLRESYEQDSQDPC